MSPPLGLFPLLLRPTAYYSIGVHRYHGTSSFVEPRILDHSFLAHLARLVALTFARCSFPEPPHVVLYIAPRLATFSDVGIRKLANVLVGLMFYSP